MTAFTVSMHLFCWNNIQSDTQNLDWVLFSESQKFERWCILIAFREKQSNDFRVFKQINPPRFRVNSTPTKRLDSFKNFRIMKIYSEHILARFLFLDNSPTLPALTIRSQLFYDLQPTSGYFLMKHHKIVCVCSASISVFAYWFISDTNFSNFVNLQIVLLENGWCIGHRQCRGFRGGRWWRS